MPFLVVEWFLKSNLTPIFYIKDRFETARITHMPHIFVFHILQIVPCTHFLSKFGAHLTECTLKILRPYYSQKPLLLVNNVYAFTTSCFAIWDLDVCIAVTIFNVHISEVASISKGH